MTYRAEERTIKLLLAGDAMPARSLKPFDEPRYLALLDLVRGADAAFANLETTVRELQEGTPSLTQGTPMSTPPALLAELEWMGLKLLSCANNHATDYGDDGMMAMLAHLRRAGIPHAGAGANLAEARKPAYLDTAAGRVALIAATTFYPHWQRAADQRPDALGRPGVNPLDFTISYTVDDTTFAALAKASEGLGMVQARDRQRAMFFSATEAPEDSADVLTFLGSRFVRGKGFAVAMKAKQSDLDGNLRWIREAKRQADFVIFSLHNHEYGPGGALTAKTNVGMEEAASFVTDAAHAAIDAGADVIVCHGPHLTLGVEIYKDRPILYSLGNFIFQNDNVPVFPAESYQRFGLDEKATPTDFLDARTGNETRGFPASAEYWHGLAAACDFRGGKLAQLVLHPLDLGHGTPRAQRGRPMLAEGKTAATILDRVKRLSERYGTKLAIDGETLTLSLN
ncbi:MAG TPA: CapA family protein [Stellaceae bacterium]|jgi:poly-gamma-glutamate synthesis protein (capsule biosynthesis protein)|nr:CapA family protein [Stellaceae bacterium]